MGPYQRTPKEVAIELLDSQVFSGSVDRGSDRWRFLGLFPWVLGVLKVDINCTGSAAPRRALGSFLEQSYGAAFGVLLGVGVACRSCHHDFGGEQTNQQRSPGKPSGFFKKTIGYGIYNSI